MPITRSMDRLVNRESAPPFSSHDVTQATLPLSQTRRYTAESPPSQRRSSRSRSRASAAAPTSQTPSTDATFTQETVTTLLAALQNSQAEAFKNVMESLLNNQARTSTPVAVSEAQATLARCKASFSGAPDESVEAFIDALESYVECCFVPDVNIVRGLSMLLTGSAATWWLGIKPQVRSWSDAKNNLISAFGDRRPPYRIYTEIFASPQGDENTDMFVSRIRALLAKLPPGDITSKAEIDIVYSLLHTRIRKR